MAYTDDWVLLVNLGFPDYECHKSGPIRRCGYKKCIGYRDKKGKYLLVEMTRGGIRAPAMNVDRIILSTFKGNPPNRDSEVVHLNHNTLDSSIDNLEWGTKEDKAAIERTVKIVTVQVPKDWISLSILGFRHYECHRSGLIRRIDKDKVLGHEDKKSPYPIIEFHEDNGQKTRVKINMIICTIFHGNPPRNNSEVIHIDGNPLNLHADNLKWGTPNEKLLVERTEFRSEGHILSLSPPNETWKDGTPYGYVGYRASTLGRLYSEKTGQILEGWSYNDEGYIRLKIMLDGQPVDTSAHIMICTIYHGHKPHPDYTVDHIDRVKTNNIPSNLRWASKSEQAFNRDVPDREYLIAQVKDSQIIDFHTKQAILEIFDVDVITIPSEGISRDGYLWIYENFTDLDIIGEIWKPINISDLIYLVSNMGRIQTTRKTFGSTKNDDYKQIGIAGHAYLMHRLVMTTFNGPISDGLVVNHIDSDRTNNRLSNLEIITASGNANHAVLSGSRSTVPVRQLTLDGIVVAEFPSIQSAADATNINPKNISHCANGYQAAAGGFKWEHV